MTFKIKLLSDLHLEFSGGEMDMPQSPTDEETILILAGDVGLAKKSWSYVPFLEKMSDQFQEVIYIMGNHEHYQGNFGTSKIDIANEICHLHNVDIYDKEIVEIGDVVFICGTFWTGMDNCNANVMWEAQAFMNDYRKIHHGPENEPLKRTLQPTDTVGEHITQKQFIFGEIKKHKDAGKKVVVVTHHAPHQRSLDGTDDRFKTDSLAGAYYSECFEDIADTKPDLWFHGHIHHSVDYIVENTRVVSNPRGYYGVALNPNFNPELLIEI